MKTLSIETTQQISGGDFDVSIEARVSAQDINQFMSLFGSFSTGQLQNTTDFVNALNNYLSYGENFDDVRLTSIQITNFN
jgi:hypothetical protein